MQTRSELRNQQRVASLICRPVFLNGAWGKAMRCCYVIFMVVLFCGARQSSADAVDKNTIQIKLAGTDWCPYTCDYSKHPGFVSEFIKTLLEHQGIELHIDLMPWPTALEKANRGEYDGLITAVQAEAPDFVFTRIATDIQRSCFYTSRSNNWTYQGLASLKGQRIGVISGYGYGSPVDAWIASTPDQHELYISDKKSALIDLLNRLESGEITALIEDRYVISHVLYRQKRDSNFLKPAGCLADNPFYLAMNPKSPYAKQIIEMLDKELGKEQNKKLKDFIKSRYGL